ncbi:MAG: NADH-quinone oxidoreductase subunit NuoN [Saezia sp.]
MTTTFQNFTALLPLLAIGITVWGGMFSIALKRNHQRVASIAVLGVFIALGSLCFAARLIPLQVTSLLLVDAYALFYMTLILLVTLATIVFAYPWLKSYPDNREEFYLLLLCATLGALVLACSNHLVALFLGIELLSLPLFGLIGYAYRSKRSLEASIKYLVLSATASSFLMFGIAVLYAANGDLSFHGIGTMLNERALGGSIQLLGLALLLVGFGFKLSLAPFHLWTPDVYEGAPAMVSGFLATVGKIGAFCLLARLLMTMPLVKSNGAITIALATLAFFSIMVGNLMALRQKNFKRLLGYSSVAHMGYLLITVVIAQYALVHSDGHAQLFASEAVGVYLAGYLLSTLVAFGLVSLASTPYERGDQGDIAHYKGLFWKQPFYGIALVVAFLSLAGIPATVGFIGKFYVIMLGVQYEMWWLVAALVAGSAMGLYYYLRVIITLFQKEEGAGSSATQPIFTFKAAALVILIATVLTLFLGIYPTPLIDWANIALPTL